jgi:choline-sulfatase
MSYNIVLIVTDQQRMDACGCYGNKIVKTPNIDKIAERGIRFSNAYCPSPLCAPSRASYITGRHVSHHGALTHFINGKDPGIPGNPGVTYSETLGSMFRKAGYATAAIGKMHVHGETKKEEDLGFSVRAHRFYTYSYQDYIDAVGQENVDKYLCGKASNDKCKYNYENRPVDLEERFMQDSLTTESSIKFITDNKNKPFFIHVGLEKPHPAWFTQPRYHAMYDPDKIAIPETADYSWKNDPLASILEGWGWKDKSRPTEKEIKNSVAAYYACVSEADNNVGRILDTLSANGLLENTVVVFTSDHGENLYHHGMMQKHCFLESAVKVPLIVAVPKGFPKNVENNSPCSLIDLMPTFADICNIKVPEAIDGKSLLPIISGKADSERPIFSEYFEKDMKSRMVKVGDWKYIVYEEHNIEVLYNLKNDPLEMKDISNNPENKSIMNMLRRHMDEIRISSPGFTSFPSADFSQSE